MTKTEFLQLMRFPSEWEALGMYPQELFELQASLQAALLRSTARAQPKPAHAIGSPAATPSA